MKVLLITQQLPFPPNSGYPIVVYHTLRALSKQNIELSLFALNPEPHISGADELVDPIFKNIPFKVVDIKPNTSIWALINDYLTNRSVNVVRYYNEQAARSLENLLRSERFDIVQFEGLYTVPYVDIVKAHSKAKLVYRAHTLEFKIFERLAEKERFFPKKKYLSYICDRLRQYELDLLSRFHQVLSISQQDRQEMLSLGCKVPIEVSPVGLDLSLYQVDRSKTHFPTLFHLGSMAWKPNEEGLSWFLSEVWPDITLLDKDLKFHIAGRHMQKYFFNYASQNLIVEAEILDAQAYINSKSIMIVPVLAGGGMRVKIIEGMALQKCIIATSIAAEGIDYRNGYDILIADTPDEFYKQILKCIVYPEISLSIGENARNTVLNNHQSDVLVTKMVALYEKLINA